MRITVFTPAYNRGYIIEQLYRSLQRQTYRDFEWLVVDDGSKDDTEQRFAAFLSEENDFSIRYIKTENGGKHRAINRGVKEAHGELFFIVDSDDYITDDALEWIDRVEASIPGSKEGYGGICGLKGFSVNSVIGTSFSGDTLDVTTLQREKYGILGDKAEVYYTELLSRYPFPEIEGERFITECVVWDRIAADGYKMRFYNKISIICNYLEDGLTKSGSNLFLNNPIGYGLYIAQSAQLGKMDRKETWEARLSYFYELHHRITFAEISRNLQCNPIVLWVGLLFMRVQNKFKQK